MKPIHTLAELVRLHRRVCRDALAIMRAKNHDYSNAAAGSSGVFGNLDFIESLGLGTTERGIVIRMGDKLSRLATLVSRPARVRGEGVVETIRDTINYGILLVAKVQSRRLRRAAGSGLRRVSRKSGRKSRG